MQTPSTLLALVSIGALLLSGCASTTVNDTSAPPVVITVTNTVDGTVVTQTVTSTPTGPKCPPASNPTVTINQAGSSTVLPIAEAWACEFSDDIQARIVVGGGGSGAGIAKFCRGELDIADASRPIRTGANSETETCRAAGIEPFEVQVAIDGLSVVVAESNTFVDCLTVSQLNRIWTQSANRVYQWSELNPAWPEQDILLYGPGPDSGTFDYWKEVIITPFDGASATVHSDFSPNEDDNALVNGVASSEFGLGYFGLAYYEKNTARLNVVKVDEGKGQGCVEPTSANVESGKYSPLARPLFMYTDGKPTGTLKAYFEKGLSAEGQSAVARIGYIALPAAKLDQMKAKIA